jgi:hypothetical protein
MKATRYIYVPMQAIYGRLSEIAPDVRTETPAEENGTAPEPMALAFTVPDEHDLVVFVLSEEARLQLVQTLTSGIVIAKAQPGKPPQRQRPR